MTDDRLEQALERLLADQSPRELATELDEEEQAMLRMAQLLRGTRHQVPDRTFVTRLRRDFKPAAPRVSRRAAFLAGLGTLAAGLVAGAGLDRALQTQQAAEPAPLVGANGRWIPVARVEDVPDGAVRAFTAGSVAGFLFSHRGQYRALSRICTHMGCALTFEPSEQTLQCPCHGAEFALDGSFRYGPGQQYARKLPPLPRLDVRVNDGSVEVWAV